MSALFVDRRQTASGRSLPNRQRLLKRLKQVIIKQKAVVQNAKVKDIPVSNTVVSSAKLLSEPSFHYLRMGDAPIVLIGNVPHRNQRGGPLIPAFERGDEFPIQDEDDDSSPGNDPGEGDAGDSIEELLDNNSIDVSKEDFLNIFFEDCQLPNLEITSKRILPKSETKHAGFMKHGIPGQLSVSRSYKNSIGRQEVLKNSIIEEIDNEFKKLKECDNDTDREIIKAAIEDLKDQLNNIPFFEELDLRYRKTEKVAVHAADAVFFLIMDVSGSMSEERKGYAKKFFALQYAFIKRKYPDTELVFIAHSTVAKELDEDAFFGISAGGGTLVSSGLILANEIIDERFDPHTTNIYISQASDGDNSSSDNPKVIHELIKPDGLLSKCRHMCFVHVNETNPNHYYNSSDSCLDVYKTVAKNTPSKKLDVVEITEDEEIFVEFHKIYSKGKNGT